MRWLLPAALALLVLPPAAQAPPPTVTVTLSVDASLTAPFTEPTFTVSCSVTVAAGSKAAAVLDQAKADGCIGNWTSIDYGGSLGRYLTGITAAGSSDSTDARNAATIRYFCGALASHPGGALLYSFWGFAVGGNAPDVGIDSYTIADGDTVAFHYVVDACPPAAYITFLAVGTWPHSPLPLEGTPQSDAVASALVV